jgi:hypothetical protein
MSIQRAAGFIPAELVPDDRGILFDGDKPRRSSKRVISAATAVVNVPDDNVLVPPLDSVPDRSAHGRRIAGGDRNRNVDDGGLERSVRRRRRHEDGHRSLGAGLKRIAQRDADNGDSEERG